MSSSNWEAERAENNARIDARLNELDLTMTANFAPASGRNGEHQTHAVNFDITVRRGSLTIYTGPYSYGVGNLPGYSHTEARRWEGKQMVDYAIENGRWPRTGHKAVGRARAFGIPPVPKPALRDVMYSLLADGRAIDSGSFENWVAEYGYVADSRRARKIYKACVKTGLALRAALGDAVLTELNELYQAY